MTKKMAADNNNSKSLIRIDNNYGISIDSIDYSLRKVKVSQKSGKVNYDTVGYYGSIQKCLKAYLKETIHDAVDAGKEITITEAIDRIELAIEKAENIIKDQFPEYTVVEE